MGNFLGTNSTKDEVSKTHTIKSVKAVGDVEQKKQTLLDKFLADGQTHEAASKLVKETFELLRATGVTDNIIKNISKKHPNAGKFLATFINYDKTGGCGCRLYDGANEINPENVVSTLAKYDTSNLSKFKENLVNKLFTVLTKVGITEETAKDRIEKMKEIANLKAIKNLSEEQQNAVVRDLSNAINAAFGDEIIPSDVSQYIKFKLISELLVSLTTSLSAEVMSIKSNIENIIDNIGTIRELLQQNFDKFTENLKKTKNTLTTETEIVRRKDIMKMLLNELQRQELMLKGIVQLALKSTPKLDSFLKQHQDKYGSISALQAKTGTNEFANVIYNVLNGMGITIQMAQYIDNALKSLGISANEYLNAKNNTIIKNKLGEIIPKLTDQDEIHALTESGKLLLDNFQYRNEYKNIKESKSGGTQFIGKTISRAIENTKITREVIFNAFNTRINVVFDGFINTLLDFASKLGDTIPVGSELYNLRRAIQRINSELVQNKAMYEALIGYYNDALSKQKKQEFVGAIADTIKEIDILILSPTYTGASAHFSSIKTAAQELLKVIDQFTEEIASKYGRADDITGGNTVEGGNNLFETPRYVIKSTKTISSALKQFDYMYNVAEIVSNLKNSSKIIAESSKDYNEITSKSIADIIARITDEYDKYSKALKNEPIANVNEATKEIYGKIMKEQYDAKLKFWRTIPTVDRFIKEFTNKVVNNPRDLMTIKTLLSGSEFIGDWYSEKTGNLLASVFDLFPHQDGDSSTIDHNAIGHDHYYEGLKNNAEPGNPFLVTNNDNAKKVKVQMDKFMQQFSLLKNLTSIFSYVRQTYMKKEENPNTLTPTMIYNNLVAYLKASAFEQGFNISMNDQGQVVANHKTQELDMDTGNLVDVNPGNANLNTYDETNKIQIGAHNDIEQKYSIWMRSIHNELSSFNSFKQEDQLFAQTIKAMSAKILTLIGLHDLFNRPMESNSMSSIRLMIGGNDVTSSLAQMPTINENIAELYVRLPLLALFYRNLFGFDNTEDNKYGNMYTQLEGFTHTSVALKISMLPDVEGTFSGLIRHIFRKTQHINNEFYSSDDIKVLINEINLIYQRMQSKYPTNTISETIQEFVNEMNRRYGIITEEERREYERIFGYQYGYASTDISHDRYNERPERDYPILPDEINESADDIQPLSDAEKLVPRLDTSVHVDPTGRKYTINKSHYELVKKFRCAIDRVFENKEEEYSFTEAIETTKTRLKAESDANKRFKIVSELIRGVDIYDKADGMKLVFFHETVKVSLTTLSLVHSLLSKFKRRIESMNIDKIERIIFEKCNLNNAGTFQAINIDDLVTNIVNDLLKVFTDDTDESGKDLIETIIGKRSSHSNVNNWAIKRTNGIKHDQNLTKDNLLAILDGLDVSKLKTGKLSDADKLKLEAFQRYFFDYDFIMKELFESLYAITSTSDDLVKVEFSGDNILINWGSLKHEITTMFESVQYFIDLLRPQLSTKLIAECTDKVRAGSYYWLQEQLIEKIINGRPLGEYEGQTKHEYVSLDQLSITISKIYQRLTRKWTVNGLTNAHVPVTNNSQNGIYDRNTYDKVFADLMFYDASKDNSGLLSTKNTSSIDGVKLVDFLGKSNHFETLHFSYPQTTYTKITVKAIDTRYIARFKQLYTWSNEFTLNRSLMYSFNQLVARIIETIFDPATQNVYSKLIEPLAFEAFGTAIKDLSNTYPDIQPVMVVPYLTGITVFDNSGLPAYSKLLGNNADYVRGFGEYMDGYLQMDYNSLIKLFQMNNVGGGNDRRGNVSLNPAADAGIVRKDIMDGTNLAFDAFSSYLSNPNMEKLTYNLFDIQNSFTDKINAGNASVANTTEIINSINKIQSNLLGINKNIKLGSQVLLLEPIATLLQYYVNNIGTLVIDTGVSTREYDINNANPANNRIENQLSYYKPLSIFQYNSNNNNKYSVPDKDVRKLAITSFINNNIPRTNTDLSNHKITNIFDSFFGTNPKGLVLDTLSALSAKRTNINTGTYNFFEQFNTNTYLDVRPVAILGNNNIDDKTKMDLLYNTNLTYVSKIFEDLYGHVAGIANIDLNLYKNLFTITSKPLHNNNLYVVDCNYHWMKQLYDVCKDAGIGLIDSHLVTLKKNLESKTPFAFDDFLKFIDELSKLLLNHTNENNQLPNNRTKWNQIIAAVFMGLWNDYAINNDSYITILQSVLNPKVLQSNDYYLITEKNQVKLDLDVALLNYYNDTLFITHDAHGNILQDSFYSKVINDIIKLFTPGEMYGNGDVQLKTLKLLNGNIVQCSGTAAGAFAYDNLPANFEELMNVIDALLIKRLVNVGDGDINQYNNAGNVIFNRIESEVNYYKELNTIVDSLRNNINTVVANNTFGIVYPDPWDNILQGNQVAQVPECQIPAINQNDTRAFMLVFGNANNLITRVLSNGNETAFKNATGITKVTIAEIDQLLSTQNKSSYIIANMLKFLHTKLLTNTNPLQVTSRPHSLSTKNVKKVCTIMEILLNREGDNLPKSYDIVKKVYNTKLEDDGTWNSPSLGQKGDEFYSVLLSIDNLIKSKPYPEAIASVDKLPAKKEVKAYGDGSPTNIIPANTIALYQEELTVREGDSSDTDTGYFRLVNNNGIRWDTHKLDLEQPQQINDPNHRNPNNDPPLVDNPVLDITNYGRRWDPDRHHVLFTSLAVILKTLVTSKLDANREHIKEQLSMIPEYMKDKLITNLPALENMFRSVLHKSEFMKLFLNQRNLRLDRYWTDTNKPDVNPWPYKLNDPGMTYNKGITAYITNNEITKERFLGILDTITNASNIITRSFANVHTELGDNNQFYEYTKNAITNYRLSNGHNQFLPISSILMLFKNSNLNDEAQFIPSYIKDTDIEKIMHAFRNIINMPHKTLELNPAWQELKSAYDRTARQSEQTESSRADRFMNTCVRLWKYLYENKKIKTLITPYIINNDITHNPVLNNIDQRGGIVYKYPGLFTREHFVITDVALNGQERDNNPASSIYDTGKNVKLTNKSTVSLMTKEANTESNSTISKIPYSIEKDIRQVIELSESGFKDKKIKELAEYVINQDVNKTSLEIQNIIDLNIVPINIHALAREIPLINIYNYAYTFDRMLVELFYGGKENANAKKVISELCSDYTTNEKILSAKDALVQLLIDPYAEISVDKYNEHVKAMMVGKTGDGLGRPKFISDQLYGKLLFGELYQSKEEYNEHGPQSGSDSIDTMKLAYTVYKLYNNTIIVLNAVAGGNEVPLSLTEFQTYYKNVINKHLGHADWNNSPNAIVLNVDHIKILKYVISATKMLAIVSKSNLIDITDVNISELACNILLLPLTSVGAVPANTDALITLIINNVPNVNGFDDFNNKDNAKNIITMIIKGIGNTLVATAAPAGNLPDNKPIIKSFFKKTNTNHHVSSQLHYLTRSSRQQEGPGGNIQPDDNFGDNQVLDKQQVKVVDIGNPIKVAKIGKLRFDTVLTRNLLFTTNIMRVLRHKLNQDMVYNKDVIVKSESIVNPEITEFYGNLIYQPEREYKNTKFLW